MANIEAELEQQLKEAGKQLSHPSDSINELLSLLDRLERLLSVVHQSPNKSMLDALESSMKALVQDSLLKHSDIDVKVAVASCVSQIMRIPAPDAPYDDDQMRDIFQLIVSSFEDIDEQSSRSYIKRASILATVSEVRMCVIMLDLQYDVIVEMFEHFLREVRNGHHESIYKSMESIMVLVLEESEEISVEMLKPLLASVKKDSEGVHPAARKLAEGVLLKSADKLKPYLIPAIVSLGDTLDKYSKVVASVYETASVEHNDENASGLQPADESKLATESSDHSGWVLKEGVCPEEADPTLDRSVKSVMINGVDVTGNQEDSVDFEPSRMPEQEAINQKSLKKKDTDSSNKDTESNPEDQASTKRVKEADTVINSTEPVAQKRAARETCDGSAKKSRVSTGSCSADASVEGTESDSTASGHLRGASAPAMGKMARQMGPPGVVDRLEGMAKESTAIFSHAAESIRALELDNSELKRQQNELVLRDKRHYEKISVLEKELADLKSLDDQMKLTFEARAADAERRATEAERRFDEYALCDQGYKEKIRTLEKEVADLKSQNEQTKLSLGEWAVDAERRASEAVKAVFASFPL